MANPCVSQADCHSATTASVVWLLALDFIFTLCVSPCPGILIFPPGQRPRKTWSFNFAEKDLLLLDGDLLLLGPFGSKVKMMAMDVQQ